VLPCWRWAITVNADSEFRKFVEGTRPLYEAIDRGAKCWEFTVGKKTQVLPDNLLDLGLSSITHAKDFIVVEAAASYGAEKKVPRNDSYQALAQLGKHSSFLAPFAEVLYVIQPPVDMKVDDKGAVVNSLDGAPVVKWIDDFACYRLQGAWVPGWLAMTPAAEIDPKRVTQIPNAEIRSRMIAKVGVDRIYAALGGKTLDKADGYQVVELDLKDRFRRVYLRMENPSADHTHLEGVPADCGDCTEERRGDCKFRGQKGCHTVASALYFRNGTTARPEILV
jgi:hypothetical protein